MLLGCGCCNPIVGLSPGLTQIALSASRPYVLLQSHSRAFSWSDRLARFFAVLSAICCNPIVGLSPGLTKLYDSQGKMVLRLQSHSRAFSWSDPSPLPGVITES